MNGEKITEKDTREGKRQTGRGQFASLCDKWLGSGRQIAIKAVFGLLYALFIVLGDFDRVLVQTGAQIAGRIAGWWLLAFLTLTVLFIALDWFSGVKCSADAGLTWKNRKNRRDGGNQAAADRTSKNGRAATQEKRARRKYMYFVFAGICFLCWLPYFLIYFPGWVSNDSVWQLEQVCGWVELSNHHPFFHTMIIKCFFMLGFRLFGTYTGAVATFVAAQMIFMACVYGLVMYDFYKKGAHGFWLALGLLFYATLPMNGLYAIYMGKDTIFAGVLLLYVREIFQLVEKRERKGKAEEKYTETAAKQSCEELQDDNVQVDRKGKSEQNTYEEDLQAADDKRKFALYARKMWRWVRTDKPYICLTFYGFLVCVLRSNGILVFAGTAVCMVIAGLSGRNAQLLHWKKQLLSSVIVLGCYLVYHGPVLNALHVTEPDTIEGLTMPTQHIISAYVNNGEITEEELALLNQAMPMENIASYYNPYYFDIVKEYIRAEGNQQVIADNKGAFFKAWLMIGLRNPVQYLDAEVRQTCGYWMFDINEPVYEQYRMAENPFGLTVERKVFSYDFGLWMDDFLLKFQDFYNRVWSLGLTTWTVFACMAYALYRRRSCLPYVPYVMLFVSLLLATPVHAEFRYTYGMFVALPLLIGATLEKRV